MSLGCVYTNGLCSRLSERTRLNRLNQRDLTLQNSAAAAYNPGVDLNTVLFNKYGYILNSTSILKDMLDVGLRRLYLDVYWDPLYNDWHLCPFRPPSTPINSTGPTINPVTLPSTATANNVSATPLTSEPLSTASAFTYGKGPPSDAMHDYSAASMNNITCDYQLDFSTLIEAIEDYVTLSDTNIAVSLLHLQLRPKVWDYKFFNSSIETQPHVPGEKSLSDTLNHFVGDRLITPSVLHTDQFTRNDRTTDGVWPETPRAEQWPPLRSLLYTDKKRMLVFFTTEGQNGISDLNNLRNVAFEQNTTISNPQDYSVTDLSKRNFTDTFVEDPGSWLTARNAGVSPVFAGGIDVYGTEMINILNQEENWAWARDQPPLYTIDQRKQMLKNGYKDSEELFACAVFTDAGMMVADCGRHFPVLCRNKTNSFDWHLNSDLHTYFSPRCPKGYHFGVPSSPLEARYVREIWMDNSADAAWVDFNSLFLPNCWVSGGTNAVCPYNVVQNDRNGIGYIAVAAAVAACLLAAIFMFEWDRGRSPLMRNSRRRDRRNTDYEGVPA